LCVFVRRFTMQAELRCNWRPKADTARYDRLRPALDDQEVRHVIRRRMFRRSSRALRLNGMAVAWADLVEQVGTQRWMPHAGWWSIICKPKMNRAMRSIAHQMKSALPHART
jgi:hypothetical protein